MSAVVDWFSSLTVYGWVDVGTNVIVIALAAALLGDYERLRKQQVADRERLAAVVDDLNRLRRQVLAREPDTDETGPILIPVADRPTPAQVPPTIPGLSSARPQPTPRTGSTAVGGRHRKAS